MDMRDEDMAEAMSLPVGTVKCHAHRGRKLIAARLRRQGMNAAEIEAIIPHRPPFRFVDEIVELSPASAPSGALPSPARNGSCRAIFPATRSSRV